MASAVQEKVIMSNLVSVEKLIADYSPIPLSLYIRGDYPDQAKIDEYVEALKFEGFEVLEPLKYFILDQATIDAWGIDDAEPGKRYILNGNNRYFAAKNLFDNSKKIKPIPVTEIELNGQPVENVYSLQILHNDTTKSHSPTEKARSIALLLEKKINSGTDETEAMKAVCKISGVALSYVKKVSVFVEPQDTTDELISEREKLFEMMDAGQLGIDATIAVIENADELEMTYSEYLDAVGEKYEPNLSPNTPLYTTLQCKRVGKTMLEQREAVDNATSADTETEIEGEEQNDDTDALANANYMTPEQRGEVVDATATKIDALSQTTLPQDKFDTYRLVTPQLLNIIKEQNKGLEAEKSVWLFNQLVVIAKELFYESDSLAKNLEEKEVKSLQRKVEKLIAQVMPKEDKKAKDANSEESQQEGEPIPDDVEF